MLGLMIASILSVASASSGYSSYQVLPAQSQRQPSSAASDAQIRFAIENKYDDTGPGAKQPQYAYNAYKTLDDALIAYLDDPDTKLPNHERERAIKKLTQTYPDFNGEPLERFKPKTVEEYTGYKKPEDKGTLLLTKISQKNFQPFAYQGKLNKVSGADAYKVTKIHHPSNAVSLAHYSRGSDLRPSSYQYRLDANAPTNDGYESKPPRQEENEYSYTYEPVSSQHLQNDQVYLENLRRVSQGYGSGQAFLSRNPQHHTRPVQYGEQLFGPRIQLDNPQYLLKRETHEHNKSLQ